MRIRHLLLITWLAVFSCPALLSQGYRIGVSIPELAGKEIILSHRFGMKFFTDDTLKLQQDGRGVFSADTLLPEGMYQVVFPDKRFVEFFIGSQQHFSLSTRVQAPADSLRFDGSPENNLFTKWQNNYGRNRSRIAQLQERLKKGNLGADSAALLNREIRTLQSAVNRQWDEVIRDLDGTLAGVFVKGMRPVKVPESILGIQGQEGQFKQYQYVRQNFLKEINFSDPRLLRTPLIETRLDQYFNQLVPPFSDTIILEARQLIDRSRPSREMFQYVVQYLLNLYSDPKFMGTDAVYVWLAENYYLNGEATWIDESNLQGIRVRVGELKPLLIGKKAPLLAGLVDSTDQPVVLEAIRSKYLIVLFWDPGCSFCKEITPKLHQLYDTLKALGAEVLAVNTHIEKDPWIQFINQNASRWINAYSPSDFRENTERWQVWSTPRIFVLGPDRTIIAKDISYDQVPAFLKQHESMNQGK